MQLPCQAGSRGTGPHLPGVGIHILQERRRPHCAFQHGRKLPFGRYLHASRYGSQAAGLRVSMAVTGCCTSASGTSRQISLRWLLACCSACASSFLFRQASGGISTAQDEVDCVRGRQCQSLVTKSLAYTDTGRSGWQVRLLGSGNCTSAARAQPQGQVIGCLYI